ncbi:thioredoxin domain-containing protein [Clostridium sp.]|jgi:thioredoxin 1|uniref:thioredoxin family protein n=1 Tax=Clostridium sp. TaxID=1506 RepID=UPI00258D8E0A|nr:thioredoxin domain-containing protein [Clostridium sp.]MDF2504987.1 thioredoxin [Clostridium sp.]
MNSNLILNIEENNFDDIVFESEIPVIVFFNAERCNVCKSLIPIVESIFSDYLNKLHIYSVDVDKYESLAKRFRLKGIPTLIIFKNGEIKEKIAGFYPRKILEDIIERALE